MTLGWLIWPFIVVFSLGVQALWRVLHRWYVPVLGAVAGFVGMWIELVVLTYQGPHWDKYGMNDEQTNAYEVAFVMRWWHHWQFFGIARLLPDGWTRPLVPPYFDPLPAQLRTGALYVCFAASLTVGSLVLLLLVVYTLVTSFRTRTQPFAEDARP